MKLLHPALIPKISLSRLILLWCSCGDVLLLQHKPEEDQFVYNHSDIFFLAYYILVCKEMIKRGEQPNAKFARETLEKRGFSEEEIDKMFIIAKDILKRGIPIYKEFNKERLKEEIKNEKIVI